MSKSDILFILPIIGEILGIRNLKDLTEQEGNSLQSIAEQALSKWNDKINKYNYSGGNLVSGKPDYAWLKRQLYENQTQQVYEFKRDLERAKRIDSNKASNIGVANPLKNVGNYFVDQGKQIGNIMGSVVSWFNPKAGQDFKDKVNSGTNHATNQIAKWGNEETYKVYNKYKDKFNNKAVNKQVANINKQQIASHNANRNALQQYKTSIKRGK